ncbi:PhoU domain-containing protein [Geomicrobium sediminis]|uniref:Phosphate transport system protein n=1 Tax=Geomicrobium sediminis TaxID=1347788 RepID=A0ABS2PGJ2_9BACL|nr:phosphate transport system protein [Geomicrobium sediminis]
MKLFNEEFNDIYRQLLKMGNLAKEQMTDLPDVLFKQDQNTIHSLIKGDLAVDHLDQDIHQRVLELIVFQPPMPSELQQLSAIMRVAREIERIGDQIVNIAEVGETFRKNGVLEIGGEIEKTIKEMNEKSETMFNQALIMLGERDYGQGETIEEQDEVVDHLFQRIQALIQEEMKLNVQRIPQLSPLFFVIRYYERLADHVVNIVTKMKESQEEGAGYGLVDD